MNIRISAIFTMPEYFFDLSSNYLQLISLQVKKNILSTPLQGVKSQELEIYICTDGTSTESSIRKISKSNKGKYLCFHCWIAYPKVVRQITDNEVVEMDLEAFAQEFFACLGLALSEYGIASEQLKNTQTEVLNDLEKNPSFYLFDISAEQIKWRKAQKKILKEMS